jgi:hypothetical protein
LKKKAAKTAKAGLIINLKIDAAAAALISLNNLSTLKVAPIVKRASGVAKTSK